MCRDANTYAHVFTHPGILIMASAWLHFSSSRFVFFSSKIGRGISIQPQIPILFPSLPVEHALSWPHPSQSQVIRHLPTCPDFITSPIVLKSSSIYFLAFLLHYSFQFLSLGNLYPLLPLGKAWTALTPFKIILSSFGWDLMSAYYLDQLLCHIPVY